MRVTQGMLNGTFMRNLNRNLRDMDKLQEQMSSGKRISKPSDDPVSVLSALRLRTGLVENTQYSRNVDDVNSWLNYTDSALNEVNTILQRIRQLAIYGANDTLPSQSKQAMAKEVQQLKEQLLHLGNSTHAGKYIFGGTQTTAKPFNVAGVYVGDNNVFEQEIGAGMKVPVNVVGSNAFNNVFSTVDNVVNDLNLGNTSNLSNLRLSQLDTIQDDILGIRAEIGAKVNRLELASNRISDAKVNFSELLSKNEDADMAKLITDLKMQENVYRASLSAGARIIQPSLLDFLR